MHHKKNTILLFIFFFIIMFLYIYLNIPIKINFKAKALILSCIDFRIQPDITEFLECLTYSGKYDNFMLAGSSLGFNQNIHPEWKKTFADHLKLANDLHFIEHIIVIDHMDCAAYKLFYNMNLNSEEEHNLHVVNLNKFKKFINSDYPNLSIECYLLDLDGNIKNI